MIDRVSNGFFHLHVLEDLIQAHDYAIPYFFVFEQRQAWLDLLQLLRQKYCLRRPIELFVSPRVRIHVSKFGQLRLNLDRVPHGRLLLSWSKLSFFVISLSLFR